MTVKFLTLLFIIFFICYFFNLVNNTITSSIKHRKLMKNLDKWRLFQVKLMNWADEIKDDNIRREYIEYYIHLYSKINKLNYPNIDESYKYIVENYSRHIPSLLKEVRDNKIKKIIKK